LGVENELSLAGGAVELWPVALLQRTSWIAYMNGQWYYVSDTAAWPGGHSTAIEAWYYHYASQQWYKIGECFTQTTHLIPGLEIVP
jgi:hypothetical protein